MNTASRWRLQFGKYVAAAYAAERDVAAIVIAGSAARGHADGYSDVEIGVFWHDVPSQEDRLRIMAQLDADGKRVLPFDSTEQSWEEDLFLGRARVDVEISGLLVEVANCTVDQVSLTLDSVLTDYDASLAKQNLIAGLIHGIEEKGSQLIRTWRKRAIVYPDELASAVVRQWGQVDNYWRWRMWLDRDNQLMLNEQIVDVMQRLLVMLLAVNRTYYLGFKWIDQILRSLATIPPDFERRFRSILTLGSRSAVDVLRELVEETYDLVETNVPDVDVDRLRSIFRWERPYWSDEPPPRHPLPATTAPRDVDAG